jgi:hypothetical protein
MKTKQYEKMSNKQQKSRVSSGNERKKGMKAKINKARRRLTATRGGKTSMDGSSLGLDVEIDQQDELLALQPDDRKTIKPLVGPSQ